MRTTARLQAALNNLASIPTADMAGLYVIQLGRAESILRDIIAERKAKKAAKRT